MLCNSWLKSVKTPVWSVNTGGNPLGTVSSQNSGKYLLSSSVHGITLDFMEGAPLPCWLPLHCEVLTPSQEPRDQWEKPYSFPDSFNTPNTSAWNNWTSTSHRLLMACCSVCLCYLPPWILTSSQWDTEPFFSVFCGPVLTCYFLHLAELSGDYMVKTLHCGLVI